jgi:3-deoxy-D-manno-octulosonic-acid transferase
MGQNKNGRILIIDTFGELFNIYSVATLVFCGASLVPLGGQNPLEPAAWGKPILYGPHMEDFMDAKEMLESTGGSIG